MGASRRVAPLWVLVFMLAGLYSPVEVSPTVLLLIINEDLIWSLYICVVDIDQSLRQKA